MPNLDVSGWAVACVQKAEEQKFSKSIKFTYISTERGCKILCIWACSHNVDLKKFYFEFANFKHLYTFCLLNFYFHFITIYTFANSMQCP